MHAVERCSHVEETPMRLQKTFTPRPEDIDRAWFVVDAAGLPLGRLATEVATRLRGKHKPTFAPHMDMGDYVIVVNAEKVALTGAKADQKRYFRHSGYPGGLTESGFEQVRERHPERIVERAVRGMLPKNRLGRATLKKLKVYAGPDHPHAAQKPKPLEIDVRKVVS
jgi:large subunit ribosomal protein L13